MPRPPTEPTPDERLASSRPGAEVDRATLAHHQRRTRGRQVKPVKVAISLRVDRDILARYRATGRGWQTRVNAAIARGARRLPHAAS